MNTTRAQNCTVLLQAATQSENNCGFAFGHLSPFPDAKGNKLISFLLFIYFCVKGTLWSLTIDSWIGGFCGPYNMVIRT